MFRIDSPNFDDGSADSKMLGHETLGPQRRYLYFFAQKEKRHVYIRDVCVVSIKKIKARLAKL